MLIRLGYDIRFDITQDVPFVALLSVHPSRRGDLLEPDRLTVEPGVHTTEYVDSFGNICTRFLAPTGSVRLTNSTLIHDSGDLDPQSPGAPEVPVEELPPDTLRYLMSSRFCEVDLLSATAVELFGGVPRGWSRVRAICDWVYSKVRFSYPEARPTRTALDVYTERVGVCRDFQHLAITFCRALNIPARLVCGYAPFPDPPPDFHAIFEAYLGGRWVQFDPTGMAPVGHVVRVATGRDAKDVAFATIFGPARMVSINPEIEVVDARAAAPAALNAGSAHRQTEQAL